MSENIKKLQDIELSEIVKKTHIEAEYIEAIISKNFDKLKDKNISAFIKIIEREFSIDMSSWLDEYKANISLDDDKPAFIPVNSREIIIKDHTKLPKLIFWAILAIILAWAIFNFKLYDLSQFIGESNSTSYSTNTTMVDVAGNKLENVGVDVINLNEPLLAENNSTKELNALEKSIILETQDANETNTTADNTLEAATQEDVIKGVSLVPTENIWIGNIDIATGKKTTATTAKEYKIDLTKEQLILTGHGLFGLKINDKIESFNDKNPHRFYVKDGKVSQISYDEFLKLNKGKAW